MTDHHLENDVYCLILTYNNRWRYLEEVLTALSVHPWLHIVIVNNGSSDFPNDHVLYGKFASYERIDQSENVGSAKGYGIGLQHIEQRDETALVWLLDDDNVPGPDALKVLLRRYNEEQTNFNNLPLMIMALRTSRKYLVGISSGEPLAKYFSLGNDFLGFSLNKLRHKLLATQKDTISDAPILLPYAPYGGLLFSISLIKQIGLPDERYFVYADDFEFTHRCIQANGRILLEPEAIVTDLEPSWQLGRNKGRKGPVTLDGPPFRVYYSIRNFVYFQRKSLVSNHWVYASNAVIYIIYLSLFALFTGRIAAFRVFFEGVSDGWKGVFINSKYRKIP